jgi:hypothetical protein
MTSLKGSSALQAILYKIRAIALNTTENIDGGKSGQDVQSTARDAAIVLSLALQHGTTIETIRRAVTRNGSGEPSSILGAIIDILPPSTVDAANTSPPSATDGGQH